MTDPLQTMTEDRDKWQTRAVALHHENERLTTERTTLVDAFTKERSAVAEEREAANKCINDANALIKQYETHIAALEQQLNLSRDAANSLQKLGGSPDKKGNGATTLPPPPSGPTRYAMGKTNEGKIGIQFDRTITEMMFSPQQAMAFGGALYKAGRDASSGIILPAGVGRGRRQ